MRKRVAQEGASGFGYPNFGDFTLLSPGAGASDVADMAEIASSVSIVSDSKTWKTSIDYARRIYSVPLGLRLKCA